MARTERRLASIGSDDADDDGISEDIGVRMGVVSRRTAAFAASAATRPRATAKSINARYTKRYCIETCTQPERCDRMRATVSGTLTNPNSINCFVLTSSAMKVPFVR